MSAESNVGLSDQSILPIAVWVTVSMLSAIETMPNSHPSNLVTEYLNRWSVVVSPFTCAESVSHKECIVHCFCTWLHVLTKHCSTNIVILSIYSLLFYL